MDRKLTVAVAGCGNRGQAVYTKLLLEMPEQAEIVAAADMDPAKLASMRASCGLTEAQCYNSVEAMLAQPRLADVMLICTPDECHYREAKAALLKDYDLLLEKPLALKAEECIELCEIAEARNRKVFVCHVLRYTPFYQQVKQAIDSGVLGQIVSVQGIEQVCYWHQAHSYVRGNWRNEAESTFMLMAKCCHDMDLLLWLTGKKCLRVASFGNLKHFKASEAPEDASERCLDCSIPDCPYNAAKFYMECFRRTGSAWPQDVVAFDPTEEKLLRALREGPYGRCVYHTDNDVVDHQVVIMELEDGVTADYTMSAFTAHQGRTIRVMGTHGELYGELEEGIIRVMPFGKPEQVINIGDLSWEKDNHNGGDSRLMKEFVAIARGEAPMSTTATTLRRSIESHLVCINAEKARLTHSVVEMD